MKINKQIISSVVFVISLLFVAYLYNYHEILTLRPQSTHKWRQTDCAAIALNYYQNGMDFLNSETHNLTSEEGKSGKAFTSEIPLLYYFVAILYKIFGPNEIIYRLLNTLIFLFGLFYLHKLVRLITNDFVWSILVPLLFFTSPVLVFYGNNFLTNSTALAFSLMGWYFFVKYLQYKKPKWLTISIVVFFLAATFKITALFSFFSIGAILFIEAIGFKIDTRDQPLVKNGWKYLGLMMLLFGIIVGWVVYARTQNMNNQCYYFSTVTFPIWNLSRIEIIEVLTNVREFWLYQYFHLSMLIFIGLSMVFVFYNFKKIPTFLKWILSILCVEIFAFIILQFWTFSHHDYYTIGLFILPIAFSVTTLYILKNYYSKYFRSVILKILIFILLVFNIFYAKGELFKRYNTWRNDASNYSDLYSIEPYLRDIGITSSDTVISIPDYSHASLYYMNQKGWTEYIDAKFNKGHRYKYNSDSMGISTSIQNGGKYLVLNGIENLYEKTYLKSFCYNIKGRYKNVLIFDLVAKDTNFRLEDRIIKSVMFCDAENISDDGKYFKYGSQLFEYGNTQTNAEKYSGNYSAILNEINPYGMTVKINDLEFGESFKLKVWRKKSMNSKGVIVSSVKGQSFSEFKIIDSTLNNWQQIETNIFIKDDYVGEELVLFLYNPSSEKVYFDNFEIVRYNSVIKNNFLE